MNRWMMGTSHRALMAPETGAGTGEPTAAATGDAAAAASSPSAAAATAAPESASTATSSSATAATEAATASATDAAATPAPERSLLESATTKPKADAATEAKPATESPAKPGDTPAPADAAKPEAAADAKKPDDPGKAKDAATDEAKSAIDPAKEATATAPPAALVLEDLKLPEGVKLLDEPAKAFLETLNKADLDSKGRAQGLIDLHLKEMERVATEVAKARDDHQRKVWSELNIERKNELKKDFGNTWETRLGMAKAVIEEYGGTPEQKAILFDRLSEDKGTGMGNDVHLNRLLANIGKALNVFEDSMVTANPKAPGMPKGSPGSGKTGWYGDGR